MQLLVFDSEIDDGFISVVHNFIHGFEGSTDLPLASRH
jgi:hypothetical protein